MDLTSVFFDLLSGILGTLLLTWIFSGLIRLGLRGLVRLGLAKIGVLQTRWPVVLLTLISWAAWLAFGKIKGWGTGMWWLGWMVAMVFWLVEEAWSARTPAKVALRAATPMSADDARRKLTEETSAAELLMPLGEVRRRWFTLSAQGVGVDDIVVHLAAEFAVTPTAMRVRLREMRLIRS